MEAFLPSFLKRLLFQFNADLRGLLLAQLTMTTKKDYDGTNAILQWNVYQLLGTIKIFSYTVAESVK